MNINIILNDLYPNGMACAVRIHLYAKGFVEYGHKVFILIPRPYEQYGRIPKNPDHQGFIDGIEFKYSALTTIRSKYFIKRQFVDIFSLLNAASILIKRRMCTDVILIVSNNQIQILLFKIIALLTKKVFIQEKSEFPFIFQKKTILGSFYQNLYVKHIYKLFDGMIVISKSLEAFFLNKIKHQARILHVPIIVDTQIFAETRESGKLSNEVVYAGILNQSKDGILDIILAFCRISQLFEDKVLVLIGDIERSDSRKDIYDLIQKNKMEDKVIITGYLPRSEMVKRLKSADVLILAKPAGVQSEHSFPTKVGEYLATGNPIVLTNVGCISQYLTDGIDAFLADPDNVESLTEKLIEVFKDYRRSVEIGKMGQRVAYNYFDYRMQSRNIVEFFMERINNKRGYG